MHGRRVAGRLGAESATCRGFGAERDRRWHAILWSRFGLLSKCRVCLVPRAVRLLPRPRWRVGWDPRPRGDLLASAWLLWGFCGAAETIPRCASRAQIEGTRGSATRAGQRGHQRGPLGRGPAEYTIPRTLPLRHPPQDPASVALPSSLAELIQRTCDLAIFGSSRRERAVLCHGIAQPRPGPLAWIRPPPAEANDGSEQPIVRRSTGAYAEPLHRRAAADVPLGTLSPGAKTSIRCSIAPTVQRGAARTLEHAGRFPRGADRRPPLASSPRE